MYNEYRYRILAADQLKESTDGKEGTRKVMEFISFDSEKFKLGHSKIFFRAGALALLEEKRDAIVLKLLGWLQGKCHAYISNKTFKKKRDQRELLTIIQKNFRSFLELKDWSWYDIIRRTRDLIGNWTEDEELRILEDKSNAAVEYYEDQIKTSKTLEAENIEMEKEIESLKTKLESELGKLTEFQEGIVESTKQKEELDQLLQDQHNCLIEVEEQRVELNREKKEMEIKNNGLKKEIEELEIALSALEHDNSNLDHTLHLLNDEVVNHDNVITKLNKNNKYVIDNSAKASEHLAATQDKLEHLTKIIGRLEQARNELDDSVEQERRARNEGEKVRRNIEGELKINQGMVSDMEKEIRELHNKIAKKEKDILACTTNIDMEQASSGRLQKQIKELTNRVDEHEDELDAERQARAKAERQRSELTRELDEMMGHLNEAGGATVAQIELNKKREYEVAMLRRDKEELHIQQEASLVGLKKRHHEAISELSEQIDELNRIKQKIEKDRSMIYNELADTRNATDDVSRSKASIEKNIKALSNNLNEISRRLEDGKRNLADFGRIKEKAASENVQLLNKVQELENVKCFLTKETINLSKQLEDVKRNAEDETRERLALLNKYRNLEHELDVVKDHLDEDIASRSDLERQVKVAKDECARWRHSFESETLDHVQELESSKQKLQARLAEAQSTVENLNNKFTTLDKAKMQLNNNVEDATADLDHIQMFNSQLEKKIKQYDVIVMEWKTKSDNLCHELDISQLDTRNVAAELYCLKNSYEENLHNLDDVRKENKKLNIEIKEIMEQISEGGRSVHDIEKMRRNLENERNDLAAALEEAESVLEQEENKVLRTNLEIDEIKKETERRIGDKEEEFGNTVKNYHKAIESLKYELENEMKSKTEALRIKKKLEADIGELETALEHANSAHHESQRNLKKCQNMMKEAQVHLAAEQASKSEALESKTVAERKLASNQNQMEECRSWLESCDRSRRQIEEELSDVNGQLCDVQLTSQSLDGAKRKLELEIASMQVEMDEFKIELDVSENKANKAMLDAARLSEELRNEQEHAQKFEKDNRYLESVCKELQHKLDEAEEANLKGGRKMVSKMESRIREMTSELDSQERRLNDANKMALKSERRLKETACQFEESQRNHERMCSLVEQLQCKCRGFKKQIEEAEEIATLNLSKYRQIQTSLMDTQHRAQMAEHAAAKLRLNRAVSGHREENY